MFVRSEESHSKLGEILIALACNASVVARRALAPQNDRPKPELFA